jgi:RNA polymerase sigma-70 factor (ECF subfamily)
MEFSDEALVSKTLESDDSAFTTLVNRHRGVVHGLCYLMARNFADAEDLAQEAFIKAYFKLSSLSNPSKFLSWLRQITINVCHDWLRRQKNDTVPLEAISIEQPAISLSPAEIYEAKELQEQVAEAIASLSEKNQQAVTLYYLDGCSCKEVADFLGTSVSVVQSRLYEARKQLKRRLMTMVKENLEGRKLSQEFDEKVRKAIEQAKKAQSKHAYREVITYCDEALNTLTKLPDSMEHKKMKREALWLKGDAFNQPASRKEAIKYYEEALELEKEIGNKSSQAHFIGEMGRHYSNVGDEEKAVEYYKQALDMFTELGDKAGQARTLYWLGNNRMALDFFVEIGDKKWEATCYAAVNLSKKFGKQIEEASVEVGPSKIVFSGGVCQEFDKSSDAVVYHGMSGRLGAYMQIKGDELKDTPIRISLRKKVVIVKEKINISQKGSFYGKINKMTNKGGTSQCK